MKIKYKIGTDSKGNYKVRFVYKYDSGLVVQETHHLLLKANVENVQEVMKYTTMHIRKLKATQLQKNNQN